MVIRFPIERRQAAIYLQNRRTLGLRAAELFLSTRVDFYLNLSVGWIHEIFRQELTRLSNEVPR